MAVFTNRAILTYNGVETPSNTVTGEILGALSITKSSLAGSYSPGEKLTFAVGLSNSGSVPMDDITVTDDLGAYPFGEGQVVPLTYVEGSAALFSGGEPLPAPEVSAGDGLTFSGIGVPAGGSVLLVYEAAVNDYAPLAAGSSITNTASASAGSAEVSASHTLGVSEAPVLAVIKSVSPSVVKENGVLTYTFVIENSGNAPAEAGELILSDVFTPVLSGLAAALDGTELSSPADYSYDDQTGEFATLEGVISVPAASCSRTESGAVSIIPGKTVLTVSGSV